jgi:hypothetical protein
MGRETVDVDVVVERRSGRRQRVVVTQIAAEEPVDALTTVVEVDPSYS